MHGVPTWEHRDPAEFRAAARKDILAHYDTTFFEDVAVEKIENHQREDGTSLFKATDEQGREWWGRKVVLVSGVKDIMPDIPGYEECWASGIGAASAGVFAIDDCSPAPLALHLARYANRLASKVTIYTHGNAEVTDSVEEALSQLKPASKTKKNVTVEARKIMKLVKLPKGAEIEVHLEGDKKIEGFIAHKPKGKQQGPWAEQLGLDLTEMGDFKTSPPFNATNVPGAFAGGDCQTPMKAATIALSHGGLLAAGVAAQLEAED
ncbi:uncharacterized protein LY89DRAFT_615901 [Mollisia scopiformis]|uniref:FAD/NAD(P)-binding domain-containing protein n=1 Tax=Mollisia scopiformis TaxID=149040 RepID=A0A194XC03_MOLSC|nr:uncharacterized protein LY89DRAFT_615901 [Mollisia scopiformis]KUJ17694.1 hypothetical protein LY89DRAFT_615901 [Mollisia scopiformis]